MSEKCCWMCFLNSWVVCPTYILRQGQIMPYTTLEVLLLAALAAPVLPAASPLQQGTRDSQRQWHLLGNGDTAPLGHICLCPLDHALSPSRQFFHADLSWLQFGLFSLSPCWLPRKVTFRKSIHQIHLATKQGFSAMYTAIFGSRVRMWQFFLKITWSSVHWLLNLVITLTSVSLLRVFGCGRLVCDVFFAVV